MLYLTTYWLTLSSRRDILFPQLLIFTLSFDWRSHPWKTSVTQVQRDWHGRFLRLVVPSLQQLLQVLSMPLPPRRRLLRHMVNQRLHPPTQPLGQRVIHIQLLPQHAVPFPTQDPFTFHAHRHSQFSARVVHQIHFKIFTHSNNTRELFIEEIPTSGISKCRDPEHFFYGLSGNGNGLYKLLTIGAITSKFLYYMGSILIIMYLFRRLGHQMKQDKFTTIPDLARQLSDALTTATASGELDDTWRMVTRMSFHDAIHILQQAPSSASE